LRLVFTALHLIPVTHRHRVAADDWVARTSHVPGAESDAEVHPSYHLRADQHQPNMACASYYCRYCRRTCRTVQCALTPVRL